MQQMPQEQCDDGNTTTEIRCPYGTTPCSICDSSCRTVMGVTGNVCGDGVREASNETCDDGNVNTCGTCGGAMGMRCSTTQALAGSTGSITCPTRSSLDDGDTFTLDDGVTSVTFEIDTDMMATVTMGNRRVDLSSGGGSAADVCDAIRASFTGLMGFTITVGGSGSTASLTNSVAGSRGNTTSTSSDTDLVVSNMAGGRARDCAMGVGCASTNDCAPGLTCQPSMSGGLTCQ
jgi:hypothetical protein